MLLFLSAILVLAFLFISVLFYLDLTPKLVLYRVAARLGLRLRAFTPVHSDAPYRRIRPVGNRLHRPVLLNLQTSDGSGQATHPDVLYIPQGFGPHRWPYWMACTPYPYADSSAENPELFVSYNGVNWFVPDGLCNPLVPTPKSPGDHHSDPDILFHDDRLWLFYRETLRSKRPADSPDRNKIHLMHSSDGLRWSVPIEILDDTVGAALMSPAVIHDGARFVLWTVELHSGQFTLMRRTSSDALSWSAPQPARILGLDNARHPWHIDVIRDTGRLSAILVTFDGPGHSGGSGSRIHYAYSEDAGLTWFASGFLLDQLYQFESKLQYRATLLRLDDHSHDYHLWYGASSTTDMFSIAYVKLARAGNNLFPAGLQPLQDKTLVAVR